MREIETIYCLQTKEIGGDPTVQSEDNGNERLSSLGADRLPEITSLGTINRFKAFQERSPSMIIFTEIFLHSVLVKRSTNTRQSNTLRGFYFQTT